MSSENGKGSARRTFIKGLCLILGIVLAVMLGITVYARYLLGRIRYAEPESVRPLSQEELDRMMEEETAPQETGSAASSSTVRLSAPGITKNNRTINILLIGQDRRAGQSRARSDTMILCTIDPGSGQITLTSFLRDLWVKIPGYRDNKINAAYAAGGMKLLNETLEKNFGVRVDGNVEVDFAQFSRIIDLLGGVEVELRRDEARYMNRKLGTSTLHEGMQTLTGEQALFYARIRALDPDADFSRTNRQRKVIDALIRKYQDVGIAQGLGLLEDILPMVTTDMTRQQIVGYAMELFPKLSEMKIRSQRIPADGKYSTPTIRGMSVVLADMDAARALLDKTMNPET